MSAGSVPGAMSHGEKVVMAHSSTKLGMYVGRDGFWCGGWWKTYGTSSSHR